MLHDQGVPLRQIAQRLNAKSDSVARWLKPANTNIFSNLQHLSPCADASVSSLWRQRSKSRVATIDTR